MTPRHIVVLLAPALLICTWLSAARATENAETAYEQGKNFLQSGRYQDAIKAFSTALKLLGTDEKNAIIVTLARAQAYFEKKDAENGLKDIETILQSPGVEGELRAQAYQLRGFRNSESGRHQAALKDFTAAIKTAHDNRKLRSTAFANRGIVQLKLKESDQAVSDLNKAIELNPKSAFAYAARGMARMQRNDIDNARADAEYALRLNPDQQAKAMAEDVLDNRHVRSRAVSFANTGIAFLNHNEPQKAISVLNQALDVDPSSAFAYAARGLAHLRSDKIEEARRDAEHTLSLNPDQQTRKMAEEVLSELSILARGPRSLSLPMSPSGHIFVQVRFGLDGKPRRFVLDTGATESLISREHLAEISRETGVREIGKGRASIADGTTHQFTRYKVKNAFLFHLPLGDIEVHVLDKAHRGVRNLLGMGSIKNIAVTFDNARKTVEITRR